MSFLENLRQQITATPMASPERNFLKLILGEIQNRPGSGKAKKDPTDEECLSIVKGMLKANQDCLERLHPKDKRVGKFVDENEVLQGFLPKYWSEDEIRESLKDVDLPKDHEGKAMGAAMKHLKDLDADVEGTVVKKIVQEHLGVSS